MKLNFALFGKLSWQQQFRIVFILKMNLFRLQSGFSFRPFFCRFSSNVSQRPYQNVEPKILKHSYVEKLSILNFTDFLADNVVYRKDDIIVTDKPYGLQVVQSNKKRECAILNSTSYSTNLTFEDIKHDLEEKLHVKCLIPVYYPPDAFTTGVFILATSTEAAEKLTNITFQKTFCVFVIIVGHLTSQKENQILTFKKKTKKLFTAFWQHEVVSSHNLCSLVKIKSSSPLVKLLLTSQYLVPILGDLIFAPKLKNLFGTVFYDKENKFLDYLDLPPEVLKDLELEKRYLRHIPAHCHLQSLTIPFSTNTQFHISVPPPDYFMWSCQKLNLLGDDIIQDKMKFNAL